MNKSTGKQTVFVAGGARGIGLGIVNAFANQGCKVMIADLGDSRDWNYDLSNKDDLERAGSIAGENAEVSTCVVDVTDSMSCQQAVEQTDGDQQ